MSSRPKWSAVGTFGAHWYKVHEEQQNNFVATGQNKCDRLLRKAGRKHPWLLTTQMIKLTELHTQTAPHEGIFGEARWMKVQMLPKALGSGSLLSEGKVEAILIFSCRHRDDGLGAFKE